MTRAPAGVNGESSVNLILAIKHNVANEIRAIDAKIAKREREIAQLREERTVLVHVAGATGTALPEPPGAAIPDAARQFEEQAA